jgi:hypothetical protein
MDVDGRKIFFLSVENLAFISTGTIVDVTTVYVINTTKNPVDGHGLIILSSRPCLQTSRNVWVRHRVPCPSSRFKPPLPVHLCNPNLCTKLATRILSKRTFSIGVVEKSLISHRLN